MVSKLIKTIHIGPFTVDQYSNIKLKKYKTDPKELEFLLGYLYNNVGNNIHRIQEKRMYYLKQSKLIIDVQYSYSLKVNKIAMGRTIRRFGDGKDDNTPVIMGEPVWICPPDKDIQDYNNARRKEYYEIEKKLKLYQSHDTHEWVISKPQVKPSGIQTITNANGFKMFKVSDSLLARVGKEVKKPTTAYKVPKSGTNESSTLIIKNIPEYLNKQFVYERLQNIFNQFGGIGKITILKNKMDNSKLLGIAFIDFFNGHSVNEILASNKKFAIQSNILLCERQKKKRT